MKLDDTTKIVSIVSVVVGLMISAAAFLTNSKLQALQQSVGELGITDKKMDISKKSFELSARLITDFEVPLARSFAIQYSEYRSGKDRVGKRFSLPTSLAEEFPKMLSGWESRKGLMTGKACEQEGLKARQVIMLTIKNVGHADAEAISVKAMERASPHADPAVRWEERSAAGKALGYYDLLSAADRWNEVQIQVDQLHGLGSLEGDRMQEKMVLASVSGSTSLYGTVLVPVSISWTDKITNARQEQHILEPHAAKLRAELTGAEIGSLGSVCK